MAIRMEAKEVKKADQAKLKNLMLGIFSKQRTGAVEQVGHIIDIKLTGY